jgi:hypothetical protein
MKIRIRQFSFLVLCAIPILVGPLTGIRAIRIPLVHEIVGISLFGIIAAFTWCLARPEESLRSDRSSMMRASGAFLLMPMALFALLWVGLATPWDATASENKMRYGVLLFCSISVTAGFVLLKEILTKSGEQLFSTIASTAGLMSGATYVVWSAFQLGDFAVRIAEGSVSPAVASMNNVFDALLFAASALAYATTAAFAFSLKRVGWIGSSTSSVFVVLNLMALTFLVLRGVSFPIPGDDPAPWYTRPGFIVGIPAVPWFMPYFLGVLLLRRAGINGE